MQPGLTPTFRRLSCHKIAIASRLKEIQTVFKVTAREAVVITSRRNVASCRNSWLELVANHYLRYHLSEGKLPSLEGFLESNI